MKLPNFLVIGAAKSGTSSLYQYLKQHPQIYMSPIKEPKFFAFEEEKLSFCGPGDDEVNCAVITNLEAYCALFKGVSDETAMGEVSPWYLYSSKAPERIQHYIPKAKLIAILRHPVDRAYSSFLHLVRDGRESLADFALALREEEKRISSNWVLLWRYKHAGFYYAQLKRYFDRFSQNQIRVYLYEDFNQKPLDVLRDIFQFLGVDETFVPDTSTKYNVSIVPNNKAAVPKNKVLHAFLTERNPLKSALKPFMPVRLRQHLKTNLKNKNIAKPALAPQLRQELLQIYREDILKLQDLIQRDLSRWLK